MKTFKRPLKIRFREADPAGILFFGNIYLLAHDAFEDFIVDTGLTWDDYFGTNQYLIPIRHTECDYLAPFIPGRSYQALISIYRLGKTSFQVLYDFQSPEGKSHAVVKTVHAFMDLKTKTKIPIPEKFRKALAPYVAE